jgi:iron complex outermembrane receptor protein
MLQKSKLSASILLAFSSGIALTSLPVMAQQQAGEATERIEVTGSRIKRADAEGALPVTVITREQLEGSGAASVAEFVRNVSFAAAGNFRPQSGSSAQAYAAIDLRGLGAERTLVLIDGRRLPKAPFVGSAVDINSIPMAMVERIEVLTDGASAVYGSDAISGVINVVTRKDFTGVMMSAGIHQPVTEGGDKEEYQALIGVKSDRGSIVAGVSHSTRGMVYTRDQPWGVTQGVSVFGNNIQIIDDEGNAGAFERLPGFACDSGGFWVNGTLCSFDFNSVAANEAEIRNTAFFANGNWNINDNWNLYLNGWISRVESFGRYAPVPGAVVIGADSPNNPTGTNDVILYHRFAAAGNRDTSTDNNVYDLLMGLRGNLFGVDLDIGARRTESKYYELGRGFIVASTADQFINDGTYDIYDPFNAPEDVLKAMTATVGRDAVFRQTELFANGSMDLFKMGGGTAMLALGAEYRKETYADVYDSLSEAGVILGSSGNSSSGDRKVTSVTGELNLPIFKGLEASIAGRFEEYSDYGDDFAPKLSVAFAPMKGMKLRASAGTGFRAPSLDILNSKTTFSAEPVNDPATCRIFNGGTDCPPNTLVQVDTFFVANPELDSEKSKQWSVGGSFDVTNCLNITADYWSIKIDDAIGQVSPQELIDRTNGTDPRPIPPGLGVTRGGNGAIVRIDAGYANEGTANVEGLDLRVLAQYGIGSFGRLKHDLSYSYTSSYKLDGDQIAGLLGQPKNRGTLANTWVWGDFDVNWIVNYIGKNGSGDGEVPAYVTHDLQVNWNTPIKGGKLTVGVVNLADRYPTLVPYDGRPFNYYLYDAYGQTPYVRYEQKF